MLFTAEALSREPTHTRTIIAWERAGTEAITVACGSYMANKYVARMREREAQTNAQIVQ